MSGRGWLLAVAGLTLAAGAGGCGKRTLDEESLQNRLKSGIETQAGVKLRSVSCPKDRPLRRGDSFTCRATTTAGETAEVVVTQTDDEGHVRYQVTG